MAVPSYNKTTARRRGKSHAHSHAAPEIKQETVEAHPVRPHVQRKSERKRKEQIKGNKKKDLFKVIAGALIALPVFQLILWWVVKQDPLSLAPTVGKYAPFVVPAKLRPQESIEVVDENEDVGDPDAPGNMRVKTNR